MRRCRDIRQSTAIQTEVVSTERDDGVFDFSILRCISRRSISMLSQEFHRWVRVQSRAEVHCRSEIGRTFLSGSSVAPPSARRPTQREEAETDRLVVSNAQNAEQQQQQRSYVEIQRRTARHRTALTRSNWGVPFAEHSQLHNFVFSNHLSVHSFLVIIFHQSLETDLSI